MNLYRRLREAARSRPHADIAVAVVVCAVTLLSTAAGADDGRSKLLPVITVGVACAPLAVRRRYPFTTLIISATAAEAYLRHYHGRNGALVLAAPLIILYTVAETSTRRRSLLIGGLALIGLTGVHNLFAPSPWVGTENVALAALGGLAITAGEAARHHRAYLTEVEARAQQAEADREAEAARRVAEERLRIARDLHDQVGHHLALIYVQAGVANHVLDSSPIQAHDALGHVRQASKTALRELGETIELLRQPDDHPAPTSPVTSLTGLTDLLATFRRSGLVITERLDGDVRPLTVAADLTAYRLIQESLTNVRKHAGPAPVDLRVTYRPDSLLIVVDNRPSAHALGDRHTTQSPPGAQRLGSGVPRAVPNSGHTPRAGQGTQPGHGSETRHGSESGHGTQPRHGNETGRGTQPTRGSETGHGMESGHGLTGMRERVAALGGSLHAGPRPDGGFRVSAMLPLPEGGPR